MYMLRTIVLVPLFLGLLCGCSSQYEVSEIEVSDTFSERKAQRLKSTFLNAEFSFVFYDNEELRVTFYPSIGGRIESLICKKVKSNIYRYDKGDVVELKFNKMLGYITSCEIVFYDGRINEHMKWECTLILKRKQ